MCISSKSGLHFSFFFFSSVNFQREENGDYTSVIRTNLDTVLPGFGSIFFLRVRIHLLWKIWNLPILQRVEATLCRHHRLSPRPATSVAIFISLLIG